jgi:Uma2 family endonuclease
MTQAKSRFRTIEDYLAYDDGTDIPYELVDGVLVEMGAESPRNIEIAMFLVSVFLQLSVPYYLIHRGTEIVVPSRSVTSRYPDLMILTEECRTALSGKARSLITTDMPAPALVIEVVSPGDENHDRDYVDKRAEYADRKIPEYWLIDPSRNVVIVLKLNGQVYQDVGQFQNSDRIISPTFSTLNLTAEQILKAGI